MPLIRKILLQNENKNPDQSQSQCENREDNAEATSALTSNISHKARKKNSVLTPEQYYQEQRRTQITDTKSPTGQILRKSQLHASPMCRRVSRAILAVSTDSPNAHDQLFDDTNYGKNLIRDLRIL